MAKQAHDAVRNITKETCITVLNWVRSQHATEKRAWLQAFEADLTKQQIW